MDSQFITYLTEEKGHRKIHLHFRDEEYYPCTVTVKNSFGETIHHTSNVAMDNEFDISDSHAEFYFVKIEKVNYTSLSRVMMLK